MWYEEKKALWYEITEKSLPTALVTGFFNGRGMKREGGH